ncbi:MAG: Rieske (2Fe-2S) protein [Gammaproteobacteria bacterium]
MHTIGPVTNFNDEGIYPVKIDGQDFLVIKHNNHLYCVEDKCGHFGMPLANGKVKDNKIYCAVHGISFDLFDGQVRDNWGEECDPIKVIELIEQDGVLYCKTPQ